MRDIKTLKRGDTVAILNLKTQEVILDGIVVLDSKKGLGCVAVHVANYGIIRFDDMSLVVDVGFAGLFGLLDNDDTRVKACRREAHLARTRKALTLWLDKVGVNDLDSISEDVERRDPLGWSVALDAASR